MKKTDEDDLLRNLSEEITDQNRLWVAYWGGVDAGSGEKATSVPRIIASIWHDLKVNQESRVVLVHGPYGSGKSSFLRALQAHIEKHKCTLWIDMPVLASHIESSALAAVMTRIYLFIQERQKGSNGSDCFFDKELEDLWRMEAGYGRSIPPGTGRDCTDPLPPEPNRMPGGGGSSPVRSIRANMLEQKLDAWLDNLDCGSEGADTSENQGEQGKQNKKGLVVFLDDLDRCESRVAMDVVRLLLRFSSTRNVHFVLASDWAVLEQGVRDWMEEYGKSSNGTPLVTPNSALEKYLDIIVRLPKMGDFASDPYPTSWGGRYLLSDELLKWLKDEDPQDTLTDKPRLVDVLINILFRQPAENGTTTEEG